MADTDDKDDSIVNTLPGIQQITPNYLVLEAGKGLYIAIGTQTVEGEGALGNERVPDDISSGEGNFYISAQNGAVTIRVRNDGSIHIDTQKGNVVINVPNGNFETNVAQNTTNTNQGNVTNYTTGNQSSYTWGNQYSWGQGNQTSIVEDSSNSVVLGGANQVVVGEAIQTYVGDLVNANLGGIQNLVAGEELTLNLGLVNNVIIGLQTDTNLGGQVQTNSFHEFSSLSAVNDYIIQNHSHIAAFEAKVLHIPVAENYFATGGLNFIDTDLFSVS